MAMMYLPHPMERLAETGSPLHTPTLTLQSDSSQVLGGLIIAH